MSKIPPAQIRAVRQTLREVKTSATLVTTNNRHSLHTRPVDFLAFVKRLESKITDEWGDMRKLQAILVEMAKDETINFTFATRSAVLPAF